MCEESKEVWCVRKESSERRNPLNGSNHQGGITITSLTMTYFHTRQLGTIIGAKAFHCPVRDGVGVVPLRYGHQA